MITSNTNFDVTVLDNEQDQMELEVVVEGANADYSSVKAVLEVWVMDNGLNVEGWTVDSDMCRSGVGITADGAGMGHGAKFFASLSR